MTLAGPVEFPEQSEYLGWLDIIPTKCFHTSCPNTVWALPLPLRAAYVILLLFQFLPRHEVASHRLSPSNLGAGFQLFPFHVSNHWSIHLPVSVALKSLLACLSHSFIYFLKIPLCFFSLVCHFNGIWIWMEVKSNVHLPCFPGNSKITLWIIKQLNRCDVCASPGQRWALGR